MGDHAADLVNGIVDPYWDYEPEEEEEEFQPINPYRFTCKYCQTHELAWCTTNNGFRLFDKYNNMHSCSAYRK